MKLRTKLLMAPLATAAVALAFGQADALWNIHEAARNQEAVEAQMDDYKTVASAKDQLGELNAGVYRTFALIASLDDAQVKAYRTGLTNQLEGVKRVVAALTDPSATDPALLDAERAIGPLIDKYHKAADTAIDLASVDPNTGIAAMQTAGATYTVLTQTMGVIVARTDALGSERAAASAQRARHINLLLTLLAALGAGAAVWMAWMMQRALVRDLAQAARLADEVAQGRLTARADTRRQDEVGDLLRSLGTMAQTLATSIRTVRESADSIRTSSSEIASGNLDLSTRTEQAASNLQQTASSMARLTGTVQQSADSARQANQLATSAAEVAAKGGQIVSDVVTTMQDINTSSRKIADIIGVIDGIAFQTNILALNAAVEAARAGEQGRGFAVVASEVRSLAQRSAQAAREIKTLIGASVDKVEGGSRLVGNAGQTMGEIVNSVQRVSDIIGEITAAAAEQAEGIGQVNSAVSQLDQMTQQNAALVEQSAAAAESLREQSQRLAQTVAGFELASSGTTPQALPAAPAAPAGKAMTAFAASTPKPMTPGRAATKAAPNKATNMGNNAAANAAVKAAMNAATKASVRPAADPAASVATALPPVAHVVQAQAVVSQVQHSSRQAVAAQAGSPPLLRPGSKPQAPSNDSDWESF
jgi:methyl-accepting chemotaxis protein